MIPGTIYLVFILIPERSLHIRPIHPSYSPYRPVPYCCMFIPRLVLGEALSLPRQHAATATTAINSRCTSIVQVQTNCIWSLSRQVEVWFCRFRFVIWFLAPKQPPVKACHRSFFLGYYYYTAVICVSGLGVVRWHHTAAHAASAAACCISYVAAWCSVRRISQTTKYGPRSVSVLTSAAGSCEFHR